MLTFNGLNNTALPGPTWVAIGNFDGVHLGHRALLHRARALAAADPAGAGRTALLTFDPHPFTVLRPEQTTLLLTTVAERLALAAAAGIDYGVVHPFTLETAHSEARDFVQLLQKRLGMRGLVVGPDFALGRRRSGDMPTLRALGAELGFEIHVVAPVEVNGQVARSSAIRELLQAGAVEAANRLLGRPYALTGEVRLGDQRGRTIGIPTANIAVPPGKLLPADGVYASWVHLCVPGRAWRFAAVANLGVRPTVDGFHHRIEAHLLDFPPAGLPDSLYGQTLTLEVIARLRGEVRFPGLDALVAQIHADIRSARELLGGQE